MSNKISKIKTNRTNRRVRPLSYGPFHTGYGPFHKSHESQGTAPFTLAEVSMMNKQEWSHYPSLHSLFKGKDGAALGNISRYESTLEKHFYKTLHELQRLQAMRTGVNDAVPQAIDITTQ